MHDTGPSLIQAAPYIARFRNQFVVIKLGGELFDQGTVASRIVPQIEVLYLCGLRPVIVHGGGKQIDVRCEEQGIRIEKRAGRRVTSPAILEVVVDVVARQLNRELCELLTARGIPVLGFADGVSEAIVSERRNPVTIDGEKVDFGEVGDVRNVSAEKLFQDSGSAPYIVPVLPSIGSRKGGGWLNINADSVASHVAMALKAQKLIMLSSVPGVMHDLSDEGPIATLTPTDARELMKGGQAVAGMRAKIEEALRAIEGGVPQVHIISGIVSGTLLHEIFTDEGCGTLISG